MSGIYIPNEKMPTNCYECHLRNGEYSGDGMQCSKTKKTISWHDGQERRMDNCPIFFIHDHGDLIDSDAYRSEFVNRIYELCADDPNNWRANELIDLYDNAPVIILGDKEV